MKLLILAVLPFLTSINMNSQEEKNSWVQYVNPLIGTEVWQSGVAVVGLVDPSFFTFLVVLVPIGIYFSRSDRAFRDDRMDCPYLREQARWNAAPSGTLLV